MAWALSPPVFSVRTYPAWSSSRRRVIRLPGVSPSMPCSRVRASASPSGSAARVATTRSRSGSWICGSGALVLMVGRPFSVQAAEQVAQRPGVGAKCRPALAGQGHRCFLCGPVPGLLAADVAGVFELAQVDDQVAGCEPDHVLQAGEGQRVAAGQCRQGRDDLQPGGHVDQRVEFAGGHGRTTLRCCCQTLNAAVPRHTALRPMPMISHAPAGPPKPAAAAMMAIARVVPAVGQSRRAAEVAAPARPTIISGALAGYSPQTGWLAEAWYSGTVNAYAATQTASMTPIQACLLRWAGPRTPAPARFSAQVLQPMLMATSAKMTATSLPGGAE